MQAMVVADLYTLSVVGLILGTFIFSAFADFFGRKLCFYIGTATCIVFTLCMIPVSHNYHLFAFFKVAPSLQIGALLLVEIRRDTVL